MKTLFRSATVAGFLVCSALALARTEPGPDPVNVGVSLFQGDGEEAVTSNFCDGALLEPGQVCFGPSLGTAVGHETIFYCTFSFFGSKDAIRGTLEFTNADGLSLAMEAH